MQYRASFYPSASSPDNGAAMLAESGDPGALELRATAIMQPSFVQKVVYPIVCRETASPRLSQDCQTAIVQNTGTGRITVGYRFGDDLMVFGKLYSDELGPHSVQVIESLWQGGFGNEAPYQVSQPLSYLPEYNLFLTRAAAGTPLMAFLGQDSPELLAYVRQAAQWLIRLHRTPLHMGRRDSLWDSLKLFRIVRRLTKAVARAPHMRKQLIDMVDRLCQKAQQNPDQVPTVQTHGRYHYEHIFANDTTVTLIDFDRSQPSDPAKDMAEFLSVLRLRTMKRTGSTDTAAAPTQVFLEEYLAHLPGYAENLATYWGAFLLLNMFHFVKKYKPDDAAFERMMQFYEEEFDTVLSGKLLPVT
jgi:hypothetical protein